ncbi:MAG: hypothetical protein J0L53_07210 [Spirochaetes bacterium]|nr:hypothetical protein [Spirochaetota bacterium]
MENLAKELYTAYCEHTGFKSLATGQDLPNWENLPETIKAAWQASANRAESLLSPAVDG